MPEWLFCSEVRTGSLALHNAHFSVWSGEKNICCCILQPSLKSPNFFMCCRIHLFVQKQFWSSTSRRIHPHPFTWFLLSVFHCTFLWWWNTVSDCTLRCLIRSEWCLCVWVVTWMQESITRVNVCVIRAADRGRKWCRGMQQPVMYINSENGGTGRSRSDQEGHREQASWTKAYFCSIPFAAVCLLLQSRLFWLRGKTVPHDLHKNVAASQPRWRSGRS